jgi:hypothetical protein
MEVEYKKTHPKIAQSILSKGLGLGSLCKTFGVSREVLKYWAKSHPDFKEALLCGLDASTAAWEEMALKIATGQTAARSASIVQQKLSEEDDLFYKQVRDGKSESTGEMATEICDRLYWYLQQSEDHDPISDKMVIERIRNVMGR